MPRMFHGLFQLALLLGGYRGDSVRQQFAAVVQKPFENTNIPIIEIGNITNLERIRLFSQRIPLVLLIAAVSALVVVSLLPARVAAVRLPWATAAASSGRTLLSHILCVRNLYLIETLPRTPLRVSDAESSRAFPWYRLISARAGKS